MVKLQDFAREMGVTDRAIQKHLKRYAEELEGLFERRGPNGTWLSEEACEFLRGKMKNSPIVVADNSLMLENDRLKKEIERLHMKLEDKQDKIEILQEQNASLALAGAQIKLLEADNAAKDKLITDTAKEAQEAILELSEVRKQFEDEKHLLEQQIAALKKAGFWKRLRGWKE